MVSRLNVVRGAARESATCERPPLFSASLSIQPTLVLQPVLCVDVADTHGPPLLQERWRRQASNQTTGQQARERSGRMRSPGKIR